MCSVTNFKLMNRRAICFIRYLSTKLLKLNQKNSIPRSQKCKFRKGKNNKEISKTHLVEWFQREKLRNEYEEKEYREGIFKGNFL